MRRVQGETFPVTGWSNGRRSTTGAGYGVRVRRADRDRYFDRDWSVVELVLGRDEVVVVPVSPSFWRTCIELRSFEVGRWLLRHGLAPWPDRRPPSLALTPVAAGRFKLERRSFEVS